jgi:hypothetical protein
MTQSPCILRCAHSCQLIGGGGGLTNQNPSLDFQCPLPLNPHWHGILRLRLWTLVLIVGLEGVSLYLAVVNVFERRRIPNWLVYLAGYALPFLIGKLAQYHPAYRSSD